MSEANSTVKTKPGKPYPEYPLTPHPSGRWCKKIRGKLHYFGKIADGHDAALANYLSKKDALHAGLTTVDNREGLTVQDLCRKFLGFKVNRLRAGELAQHTYDEYGAVVKRFLAKIGKDRLVSTLTADDFAKARKAMVKRKWGVYRIATEVVRIRTIFNYGVEGGLIERLPVYGLEFSTPSKKDVRKHRATVGSRLLSAVEVCRMIDDVDRNLKAMILLGLNGALSNSDLANLTAEVIDIEGGWLNYARVKTGIERRIPLWPETVEALRDVITAKRTPNSPKDAGLIFITKYGESYAAAAKGSPISQIVRKLLARLDIQAKGTTGKGFYSLRRTFQNVGEESKDFLAVRAIMGHATNDVSEFYRERMSDARLKAVADHVRTWLLAGRAELEAKEVAS